MALVGDNDNGREYACRSFNGPELGGPESEREKEADVPWFPREANRVLFSGLALLHVGTGRPLQG